MNGLTNLRNKLNRFAYLNILKPIFFLFDPELMHRVFIKIGRLLGSNILTKSITSLLFNYQNKKLGQNILGMNFRNPVGLAAGFDKDGEMMSIMEDVGFGFVEIGSITANPSPGNPGKRFARLIDLKSLWVHFGLNNKGVIEISNRIKNKNFKIPVFASIAKTNSKETSDPKIGLKDYLFSIEKMKNISNAIVLNISCPNAYGGRDFANPSMFEDMLKEISKLKVKVPIFVKLSPDLDNSNIDKIIKISSKYKISGFICSNLSKKHHFPKGGLSGKPIEEKSNKLLEYLYRKTKGKFILIGTGGIFSAEDAYRKIKLGANLVQLITGMIYEGPSLIGNINYDLVKLLKRDGFKNISEAVGKGIK